VKVHHSVISDEISKGVQTTGRWICGVCGISVLSAGNGCTNSVVE